MHIGGEAAYRICETGDIFGRLPQQMQGQAQGTARTYTGKGRDGIHRISERTGWKILLHIEFLLCKYMNFYD